MASAVILGTLRATTRPGANSPVFSAVDRAEFLPLFAAKKPKVIIREFEVENIYKPASAGSLYLQSFSQELKKKYSLQDLLDSKYRQSMRQL